MKTKACADPWLSPDKSKRLEKWYAGDHYLKTPLISPLYADLGGLPPVLIQVGTQGILLDDSTRLADRVREAGGEATLEIWKGMFHVFQAFGLPESNGAIEEIGAFVREQIPPGDN